MSINKQTQKEMNLQDDICPDNFSAGGKSQSFESIDDIIYLKDHLETKDLPQYEDFAIKMKNKMNSKQQATLNKFIGDSSISMESIEDILHIKESLQNKDFLENEQYHQQNNKITYQQIAQSGIDLKMNPQNMTHQVSTKSRQQISFWIELEYLYRKLANPQKQLNAKSSTIKAKYWKPKQLMQQLANKGNSKFYNLRLRQSKAAVKTSNFNMICNQGSHNFNRINKKGNSNFNRTSNKGNNIFNRISNKSNPNFKYSNNTITISNRLILTNKIAIIIKLNYQITRKSKTNNQNLINKNNDKNNINDNSNLKQILYSNCLIHKKNKLMNAKIIQS
ncbi:hypothetical protein TTHERM_00007540 (macronuclear) [Tetrahymena thermophila SB210]|uniref:Uncharacterized protein n=1 Tax=Tetrahymena thermophila (strain SB210) TaxID=312017 RepID=Q22S81_TETTS|nr:hypothetical protein TTHERM_00007540 [Tetrahymena thermophila SB210]EAR87891.2 hypothetical protein TTHERM_00007540 [Tetrahymena thermophila SB210]|eukprot:XP_001008136.2 hypothetical protein TTHERM_00007540 [Tetrahymena thermophila SB210]